MMEFLFLLNLTPCIIPSDRLLYPLHLLLGDQKEVKEKHAEACHQPRTFHTVATCSYHCGVCSYSCIGHDCNATHRVEQQPHVNKFPRKAASLPSYFCFSLCNPSFFSPEWGHYSLIYVVSSNTSRTINNTIDKSNNFSKPAAAVE